METTLTQFYYITAQGTIFNVWAANQLQADKKVSEGLSYLRGVKPYNK